MSQARQRCFVIGPIGVEGSPERKHSDMLLHAVIREALKDWDPPYDVVRSDELSDPGMITDVMIHEIMNAELVVADLTYLNPNAFYELGIRHATEKPAIHFAQSGTKLPFDAMTHRAVIQDITSWEGIERARQQIREAAKRTEAPDYRVSNPITQANASFKMLESSDPFEQVVAELQIRVEQLEARNRRQFETVFPAEPFLAGDRKEIQEDYEKVLLAHLPDVPTDVDRMLVAGYIIQSRSLDEGFSTGEANALLTEHGIKVGNPSQLVKQNLLAKRVFKHQDRYRISQIGLNHLRLLVAVVVT